MYYVMVLNDVNLISSVQHTSIAFNTYEQHNGSSMKILVRMTLDTRQHSHTATTTTTTEDQI
jgi:hypothetical protein